MNNPYSPIWKTALMLLAGVVACVLLIGKVYDIRGKYVTETISEFGQLPSPALQVLSLEFKGVISDYLLFKTLTYLGLKITENKNPTREEWSLVHQMLERVTDLDPRFWDPYLFAEMMLVWQAGMFDEAGALLEKAARYRPQDYRPHYYLGFNYFYFKKDAVKAAPHFRQAALSAQAPAYVKGLASRISLYAGQTSVGVFFLENLIKETSDPKMVKRLEKRLLTLKMIFYLEEKVKEYKARNGVIASLEDLVTAGFVQELPTDPYGGNFMIYPNGRVYTTSELVEK